MSAYRRPWQAVWMIPSIRADGRDTKRTMSYGSEVRLREAVQATATEQPTWRLLMCWGPHGRFVDVEVS